MTLTLDLAPGIQARLEQEAAKRGQEPAAVVMEALERLLPPAETEEQQIEVGWQALMKLIDEHQMDTGIADLAHQHDHYIYGTPKREPYSPEAGA